ncbi:hypothetical protein N7468_006421 [Penicillium chermesinum]|uniref:Zn(2)-C6 fungal-type domain-containing protein n=1 Tax=Penicillium chermesinum TaxID=63820 RepID=A0A9W9NS70_9EURO|nr:uncharacterized protein N7468_006421 [Penicillium chermesinum]KAJ5225196.1 hypothetical protein N7468_006421 [Penicillium chermesinum]
MSTSSRRRNRSLASCEPCRKAKVRCDHQKPVCGGCLRRQLQNRCWYHPAPLTRRATAMPTPILDPIQPISNLLETHTFLDSPQANESVSQGRAEMESIRPATFKPWLWPFASLVAPESRSYFSRVETESKLAHEANLATMIHLVSKLSLLPTIERLLNEYYKFSQAALVARPIVSQLIASMKTGLTMAGYANESEDGVLEIQDPTQLARGVLQASSLEITITPSLDPEGFCALFTGPCLRVEALGLVYTIAARSALYFSRHEDESEDALMQDMIWYSDSCLRLARELSPRTTDLIIWLAQENLQLTTLLAGDAGLHGWRRVSDLSNDVFALGLNREATYSSRAIPFFLAECRRKTYASSYYLDKVFAIVLSRPPRMSARHADCKLPLDLASRDIFVSSEAEVESSCRKVTSDGWANDSRYHTTTWARVRCILGVFREEMIEFQISAVRPVDKTKLLELFDRCIQVWDSLPPHLKYRPDCWDSDIPVAGCFMLGKIYLSYLHIQFYIQRILGEGLQTPLPMLLELSSSILETVIQMTNSRNKTSFTFREVPEILLSYGLPCASILITALESASRDPTQPLPPLLKPSALIRNLSVLVANLDLMTRPGDPNHTYCQQASKTLSRKLDRILDSFAGLRTTGAPIDNVSSSSNDRQISDITPQTISASTPLTVDTAAGFSDLDNIDLADFDNFDLATWVMDVDLDPAGGEWNTE